MTTEVSIQSDSTASHLAGKISEAIGDSKIQDTIVQYAYDSTSITPYSALVCTFDPES